MFKINEDMSIYVTRGDAVHFVFTIKDEKDGTDYIFRAGEVVRFKVVEKKACENVMFYKDFPITEETGKIDIVLSEDETRIGDVISKPTDYWYEIELNPFENPRTIIGYDEDGAKIFKLFPEGKEIEKDPITPEDIPIVDTELNMTSTRPVENQAISRAIVELRASVKKGEEAFAKGVLELENIHKEIDNLGEIFIEDNSVDCISGLKGFHYKAVDREKKIIYLTKEQCNPPIIEKWMSYYEYNSMSVDEQKAWFESFPTMKDFFDWFNGSKTNPAQKYPAALSVDIEEDLYYSENAVGKLLSVCNDSKYENSLKITEVEAGKIYYELVDETINPFETVSQTPMEPRTLLDTDCDSLDGITIKGMVDTTPNGQLTDQTTFSLTYGGEIQVTIPEECTELEVEYAFNAKSTNPSSAICINKVANETLVFLNSGNAYWTDSAIVKIHMVKESGAWNTKYSLNDSEYTVYKNSSGGGGDNIPSNGNDVLIFSGSSKVYYNYIKVVAQLPALSSDDFSIWCHDCCDEGVVDLGFGSFATGDNTKATNRAAFASGRDTHAYGQYGHAEGRETKAGYAAHAEGRETEATNISHAEGRKTKATGTYSHAEGSNTEAAAQSSHAEGNRTKATGQSSHAEGLGAKANGMASHSEGYGTVATGNYQHVEGRQNIEDTEGKYLHIAGNGTDSKRSNAYTLDWNGNAWFAGEVYAGGKNQDNADVLMKKTDADNTFLKKTAFTFDAETGAFTLTL